MRCRRLPITALLLLSSLSICLAQYSDSQLYRAYLERDMRVWADYIASVDASQATAEERLRLLNYQYGYTAYAISIKQENARQLLDLYKANLEDLRHAMPEATYWAYKAGASSYELSLNRWQFAKYSKQIYADINHALSADPNNPLALTMKGNVEFYSPVGSKHEALLYYEKADSLYHAQGLPPYLWNVRAVQLTLVKCLEKTKGREVAMKRGAEFLSEEPDFHELETLLHAQ